MIYSSSVVYGRHTTLDNKKSDGNGNGGNGNTGTSLFGQPGIGTGVGVEPYTDDKADRAIGQYNQAKDKASEGFHNIANDQYETDPTSLNKNQDAIYSEDGGQYGRANRRSYETTLQLSREADAYNNKPTEQLSFGGPSGATGVNSTTLVDPYNRPKIETEEMREMQKSRQLDLNQKQLAQDLQAAINRKDYDAFKQLYQSLTGLTLSNYQLETGMRTFQNQQLIQQALFKDSAVFNIFCKAWGIDKYANAAWQMAQTNPGLATLYVSMLTGFEAMDPNNLQVYLDTMTFRNQGKSINDAYNMAVEKQQRQGRNYGKATSGNMK